MFFVRKLFLLPILITQFVFFSTGSLLAQQNKTMVFNTEVGSPIKHASGLQVQSTLAKRRDTVFYRTAEPKYERRRFFQLSIVVTNSGTDDIIIHGWQFQAICPEDNLGREWESDSFISLTAPAVSTPFTLKPGEKKTWLCKETDFSQCQSKSGDLDVSPEYVRASIDAVVLSKNEPAKEPIDKEILDQIAEYKIAKSSGDLNKATEIKDLINELAQQAYPDRIDEIKELMNGKVGSNENNKPVEVNQVASVNKTQPKNKELKGNSVAATNSAKGIEAGVYNTPSWDYPISIKFAENGNLIYKNYRETVEYKKTSEGKFIHPTSPNVYIEASEKNKLIHAESTSQFKREFTLYSPYNATPAKGVMSFLKDGDKYYAVPCNDAMFTGIYEYEGKGKEPIIQLNADQSGLFQRHGVPADPITWWIESDYKGNIQKVEGPAGYRFFLVMKETNGTFNRVFLEVLKDGSKAFILRERIKQGPFNVNSNPCPASTNTTEESSGGNEPAYVHPNPSTKKPVKNPYAKPIPTRTSTKTDVVAIPVPEYVKGISRPFTYSSFQPSFNGMYIGFYPTTASGTNPSQSNVFKLQGPTWIKSHHERYIFAYDAERHQYEQNEELTFQWAGSLTKEEQTKLENSGKKMPKANQKIGIYTKNNSSNTPSTENRRFQKFFQLISAPSVLPEDKKYYPTLFGIGPDYETADSKIYCWVESRTDVDGYTPVDLNLTSADLGSICMAASDEDSYIWIGSGQKIIKVTSSEETSLIDLAKFGAKGKVTKMIVNEGELWILCGNQLFKISKGVVSLFYTATYGLSSFAVDNSTVYMSDGNKISKDFHKLTPIFGDAPKIPLKINDFNQAKSELPNCLMEASLDVTDRYLYLFSPFSGTIYKVEK